MGENEGWLQPPNGLLPNEVGSVMRVLDTERWGIAEERTAELIACVQPNAVSEERRSAVAVYVQKLIMKCFPCQVFTFGSVPLKTYLPDGDIDLTAFSNDKNLKDTWAHQVRDALENEEKNENAEFLVKEIQYIQAEVKIIKCLVENIVVDISFNQLGGLCTLCFLEQVDKLIEQNHLFKRSIILIKAWCYYESRILGAHHGLISTYALETLVLYIFHVFNNTFAGPLEVLYRFLEFFSKFDWDNFCISLWGPVPINSLPDATEPPRKDGGDLLLSKLFLDACSLAYSVAPSQEHQNHPFVSKHFNIIDPLRTNNNLGRSVSKGNFYRIRSAFAFGAKSLARVLNCPKEDIHYELNQFFTNTWDRHGSGRRPDARRSDRHSVSSCLRPLSEDSKNKVNRNKDGSGSGREDQVDGMYRSRGTSSQHVNVSVESSCRSRDVPAPRAEDQKRSGSLDSSVTSDSIRSVSSSSRGALTETDQKNSQPIHLVNDIQGRHFFARTSSSPELTDSYNNISSQHKCNGVPESKRSPAASARLNSGRGKNLESDNCASRNVRSSNSVPSSVRPVSSNLSTDAGADMNNVTCSHNGSSLVTMREDFVSDLGPQGMHQEQDLSSVTTASAAHGYSEQTNLAPQPLPLRTSPPFLASMGFAQRNTGGMVCRDTPFTESPWSANMKIPYGQVSTPQTHYFHKLGLTSCSKVSVESNSENSEIADPNPGDKDHKYWHEFGDSNGQCDQNYGGFEMHQLDNKQQSSSGNNFGSFQANNVQNSGWVPPKFSKSNRGPRDNDYADTSMRREKSGNGVYYEDRRSPSSFSGRNSVKSRNLLEQGSTAKFTDPTREKRGRKYSPSLVTSTGYGKGKSGSEHSSASIQAEGNSKNWNLSSAMVIEMPESTGPQSVSSLHYPRLQISEHEWAPSSESDTVTPAVQGFLGSQPRVTDSSGPLTFAFYPAGPPVPFVMVPFYNFPRETGNADASSSHFSSEEGIVNHDSGLSLNSPEVSDQPDISSSMSSTASAEPEEHNSDILNGDFASHWQNLQFGRFCQNSQIPAPFLYPSPMMAPPGYVQSHCPQDGPGRLTSINANIFNQSMGYGPRLVPVAPLRPPSNRPAGFYQHIIDEIPRYRNGTGTYLPNPASFRDRHSTATRRGANRSQNPSYDRSDHVGRSQNPRQEQTHPGKIGAEAPWEPSRHESFPSLDMQNGPIRDSEGNPNMAYGVYPLQGFNPNGMSSNGPGVSPLVMFYPYDHNSSYRPTAEQLEFGSLGPVAFSGSGDTSPLSEGTRSGGASEEQMVNGVSADQPSSTYFQRQ